MVITNEKNSDLHFVNKNKIVGKNIVINSIPKFVHRKYFKNYSIFNLIN